jgi:hypothetical protein
MDSVKSISAGSTLAYSVGGTATHGGGSCQISMSYDFGVSWNVIHSIIGGCMNEGLDLSVEIPSEAPSGEALFSWSWFNHLGNREVSLTVFPNVLVRCMSHFTDTGVLLLFFVLSFVFPFFSRADVPKLRGSHDHKRWLRLDWSNSIRCKCRCERLSYY